MGNCTSIKVRAPASIANIGPGFDILAMAIEGIYDIVEVTVCRGNGSIDIKVEGLDVPLGKDNIVYAIAQNVIAKYGLYDIDIAINIVKGVPPASGLGSSGASSAATAYAFMKLLNREHDEYEMLKIAGEGEAVAVGTPHYDNVAASLFGGIVVLDLNKERVYKIKPSFPIHIAIVIPKGVVKVSRKTEFARSVLPKSIDLATYVKQSSALAKLMYALMSNDIELFGEAVSTDFIAEPYRANLIPYYYELKELALKLGALGFNISGAGPAVFSIYRSSEEALNVGKKLISFLNDKGLYSDLIVTRVSHKGAEILGE
ncbi:MAG: homoserine kinase [Ignisphaera sp.]